MKKLLMAGVCVALLALSTKLVENLYASEFSKAVGISEGLDRLKAVREALYWSTRSMMHQNGGYQASIGHGYGVVAGLTKKGLLVIKVYEDDKIQTRTVQLADVTPEDAVTYAKEVITIQNTHAEFDFYNDNQVVVWFNRQPWNVQLIKSGAMRPDEKPPTNIVDNVFAEYYWRLSRGQHK